MNIRLLNFTIAILTIGILCVSSVFAAKPSAVLNERTAELSNDLCKLTLDIKTGEILSLTPGTSTLRGKWFEVEEENRNGMEPWETWKFGETSLFTGGNAKVSVKNTKDYSSLISTWNTPNGNTIEAEIKLSQNDKGPLFRLKVANNTGSTLIDKIKLPVLENISIGNSDDDWFAWPHTLGARIRVDGFKNGQILEDPYPGFMYMQWIDLYDENEGVYVGCNDDYGYSKSLFIGKTEDGKSIMGISFTGCWIAKRGDSWTTPWVQIASHKGDWRSGADIYRIFAQKAFGPINPPQLIKDMPTVQCWLAHHASNGDIGKLFEIQQQAPIHASYLTKSMNTSIPEGWDGILGSALEYQDSFDKIKSLGGHSALFTFDRAVLMGRTNYADYASKWLNIKRDGSFETAFRDMMPSPFDPNFVRARIGEAVRWVRDFNLDELHYDTEGTSGFTGIVGTGMISGPSYNMKMSQRPNEVPHYFKKLYQETLRECRKFNPDFTLRAEHCADFFYPEFTASTAHFLSTATGQLVLAMNQPKNAQLMPMLFCYTLPQHAVYQMPSVSADDFWVYGYGMGHGFHGGGPSWSFNPGVRDYEYPPGELSHRYRFYDKQWRLFYDFRVGFSEAVIDGSKSDKSIQALINGKWEKCEYPGPIVAVTHIGGKREVTLGMWYGNPETTEYGRQFLNSDYKPKPTLMMIPTNIKNPQVKIYDINGVVNIPYKIKNGNIEVEIPDTTYFAVEAFNGPEIMLKLPDIAEPGSTVNCEVNVKQTDSIAGKLEFHLPPGWNDGKSLSIKIPADDEFTSTVKLKIPEGIFGRNYPIKAVFSSKSFKRTVASHLKVMEPLTFLYTFKGFDDKNIYCIDKGEDARLILRFVNNTKNKAEIKVTAAGEGIAYNETFELAGINPKELGKKNGQLTLWADMNPKAEAPANAAVKEYVYQNAGIPASPIVLQVYMNGKIVHQVDAYPRNRLMDLNGEWQVKFIPRSNVTVAGVEGGDSIDMQALTPDIWDGNWYTVTTPFTNDKPKSLKSSTWTIYRKMVYIPSEWQGTDIWLRLCGMGDSWGEGTLSLVYVNGWPAGRIGQSGEKELSPLLNYGAWNLLAIGAFVPDIFADSYLFARNSPKPQSIEPHEAVERPDGAFLLMSDRPSGQGISLPFIKGIGEGDYKRTSNEMGGENVFIYFAVADEFIYEPDSPVEVEIEYLDNGYGEICIDYDSTDPTAIHNGAFKSTEPIKRTNTNKWIKNKFIINDARFSNRQHHGSDFRISGKDDDLKLKRIDVRIIK